MAGGTQGLAHANFFGSLTHNNGHDVGHTHRSREQGHQTHKPHKESNSAENLPEHLCFFILVIHPYTLGIIWMHHQSVLEPKKQTRRRFPRILDGCVACSNGYPPYDIVVLKQLLRGRKRHVNAAIFPPGARLIKCPDNSKLNAPELNELPNHVRRLGSFGKKVLYQLRTQDGYFPILCKVSGG